jgi:hypothetical protein
MIFKVFCSSPYQSSFPRTLKTEYKVTEAQININRHKKYVNIDVKFHNRNMILLLTRGPWTRTCPGKGNFSLLNNLRALEDKSTDSPSKRKACKA